MACELVSLNKIWAIAVTITLTTLMICTTVYWSIDRVQQGHAVITPTEVVTPTR